jgi:hypothetical protein
MRPVVANYSLYLAGYGPEGFTFLPYENENNLYPVKAKLPQTECDPIRLGGMWIAMCGRRSWPA